MKNKFQIDNSIFELLFRTSHLGILIINENGQYLYSNKIMNNFLEISTENFKKKNIFEILKDKFKNPEKVLDLANNSKIKIQSRNKKYFEIVSNFLNFKNESTIKVFWFRDFSSDKREEEIINNYFSNLYHDIRSPISDIISWSARLKESKFSQEEQNYIFSNLEKIGQRALDLVENYLRLLKIEQGMQVDIIKEKFLISDLIEEIKEIFNNYHKKSILKISLSDPEIGELNMELFHYQIFIQKSILFSLLNNLVINACQASQNFLKEKILVNLYLKNDIFCFSISNFGKVPEKIQAKLFQKFVTNKKNGTGLGLYFSRINARILGGDLIFKDLPRGTRFTLQLPVFSSL